MNISLNPHFCCDVPSLKWIAQVYPLYLHDISSYTDSYRLDENGLWQPDYVGYWIHPESPTIVGAAKVQDERIGFACIGIGDFPYKRADSDFKLSEFFVLRGFRRRGLARAFAVSLLANMPGRWELDILDRNVPARMFWEKLLTGLGARSEEQDGFRTWFLDTRA